MVDFPGYSGNKQTQGFSLRDVVYIIFRRRLVIAAVMLPIVVVASLGLFQDSRSTVAACKILIELQAAETPRWNTRIGLDYDRELSTLAHMAMSMPVARLAAEGLQDSLDVITRLEDGAFSRLEDINELSFFLYDKFHISPVGESSILVLRFASRNPRLALMSVAACREAFLKYAITVPKNLQALEYYNDQVRLVRDEIEDLLTQRADIVTKAGFGTIEFDLRGLSQQLTDMRNTLLKDTLERAYIESKVAAMRRAQEENPSYVPSPDRADIGVAMLNARNRAENIQAEEIDLLTRYTEDHVEVRRVRERLLPALAVLANEVDNYISTYELEAKALRVRETVMQAHILNLENSIAAVPEVSRHVGLLDTQINAKNILLRDLQIKRGEVLINSSADERITSIIRLTEPEIETVVSEARKFIYFALVVMFGLIFALTIAIVVDSRDHRLHSPESAGKQLGVPVLAAVTKESPRRTGT